MSGAAPVKITESIAASIAAIERGLALRPMGATLRDPSPETVAPDAEADDDPEPFRKALPHAGPWPCYRKCGALSDTPGVCVKCGDKEAREEAREEFRAALDSIPQAFRWARVDAPDLASRCGFAYDDMGFALSLASDVIPDMVRRLLSGDVLNCLLRGEPDAGKTSVACAIMQSVIDMGIDAWVQFCRRRPRSRLAPATPEPKIVTIARGARFVAASDLLPLKVRGVEVASPKIDIAMSATLLVLDDVGEELPKRPDGYGDIANRVQATRDVFTARWGPERPIVATTNLSNERIMGAYTSGVLKRMALSKRVAVVELTKRGG